MFKSIELKLLGALTLLVLILGFVIWQQENALSRLRAEKSNVIQYAQADSLKSVYYRNKLDLETAKTQTLQLSLRDAQKLITTEHINFVTQFEGVRKNLRNLEQATSTTAKIVGDWKIPFGDTTIVNLDSSVVRGRKFDNKNEWIHLKGFVTHDTVDFEADVSVQLQTVLYWQRSRFLGLRVGKKKWFTEIASPNPYVHITKQEVIKIEKR